MKKINCIGDVKIINNSVLTIYSHQRVDMPDGKYQIKIQDIPKKRTLRQNRYLWALIGEIAKLENGDLRDIEKLYCRLLEFAGAKYEVIYIDENAMNSLIKQEIVRRVVPKAKAVIDGRIMIEAYIFYGSSKMSTAEMSDLIDTTLRYASEVGINIPYWRELLTE